MSSQNHNFYHIREHCEDAEFDMMHRLKIITIVLFRMKSL